jgi:hypothetical protein
VGTAVHAGTRRRRPFHRHSPGEALSVRRRGRGWHEIDLERRDLFRAGVDLGGEDMVMLTDDDFAGLQLASTRDVLEFRRSPPRTMRPGSVSRCLHAVADPVRRAGPRSTGSNREWRAVNESLLRDVVEADLTFNGAPGARPAREASDSCSPSCIAPPQTRYRAHNAGFVDGCLRKDRAHRRTARQLSSSVSPTWP